MRLTGAKIHGYGRLVDTKINLDSKLIAVVGPNEAGKTTLLKALRFLDEGAELSPRERSRAIEVKGSDYVVEAYYVLEDSDNQALQEFDLETMPRTAVAKRPTQGGSVEIEFDVEIIKRLKPLQDAYKKLTKFSDDDELLDLVSEDTIYNDPGADSPIDFRAELVKMLNLVQEIIESDDNQNNSYEDILRLSKELASPLVETTKAKSLLNNFNVVSDWIESSDIYDKVAETIWNNIPVFLMFNEDDRMLNSTYTLDENLVQNTPKALSNLLDVAGLDLSTTLQATRDGDIARRSTALNQANKKLRQLYRNAWKQSDIGVELYVDGAELRVNVLEDDEKVTIFDERSAGMRMFIALIAFLETERTTANPPILLIDEAENHLHIDAQADLVTMFMTQDKASKVIYTTHSPACLPPDLGTSIRSVVPAKDGVQKSSIVNAFWVDGAGFSPLMIAMGAAAAAYTPARYAVLAEGATEMILLPSIMRALVGQDIPYQVAPGLSEVPSSFYAELDLEAAKVAYLVDGDKGGSELKKKLIASGINEAYVFTLPTPGIENLLNETDYVEAVRSLLLEKYDESQVGLLPKLGLAAEKPWTTELENWVNANAMKMPSKVAVANAIVNRGTVSVTDEFSERLRSLHAALMQAVGASDK